MNIEINATERELLLDGIGYTETKLGLEGKIPMREGYSRESYETYAAFCEEMFIANYEQQAKDALAQRLIDADDVDNESP